MCDLIERFDFVDDSLGELCGFGIAANIFGQVFAFSIDVEDRFLDQLGEAREAAVHEQVRASEDEVGRVGLVLPGQVESGSSGSG